MIRLILPTCGTMFVFLLSLILVETGHTKAFVALSILALLSLVPIVIFSSGNMARRWLFRKGLATMGPFPRNNGYSHFAIMFVLSLIQFGLAIVSVVFCTVMIL